MNSWIYNTIIDDSYLMEKGPYQIQVSDDTCFGSTFKPVEIITNEQIVIGEMVIHNIKITLDEPVYNYFIY